MATNHPSPFPSQTILSPPTPDALPPLLLLQPAAFLQPHPALNPLLTPHLAEPTERPGKRKPLLIPAEQRALLQHAHIHPQIVHKITHDIVNIMALIMPCGP